jgi:hypothetical protein
MKIRAGRVAVCLIAVLLAVEGVSPAGTAGLQAGEYACAGSGGRILIGLGFKLRADGTYTDLDGKTSGQVVYKGLDVTFVGGHLDGQVGRNVRNGTNFEIHSISCSLSRR